jgi:hypothetical protein
VRAVPDWPATRRPDGCAPEVCAGRNAEVDGGALTGQPPASITGAEVTTGVHWYRGTYLGDSEHPVGDVLAVVAWVVDAEPVVTGAGRYGYLDGYAVGPVAVFAHSERSEMGVMVDIDGSGCEALGWRKVAEIHDALGLRATRLDLAVDHCPFTPCEVRDAWRRGDVRTRVKVREGARADRQWRRCFWQEFDDGDLFTMGSRQSTQYARCYDRRGFTRLELELKDRPAQVAADELMRMVGLGDVGVSDRVLSWVRRFVDFVVTESDTNASRRSLLPWWAAFVGAVPKAHVVTEGKHARTCAEVREWFGQQMAAMLAVLSEAYGAGEVARLVRQGRKRWRARHRVLLATVPGRQRSRSAGGPPRPEARSASQPLPFADNAAI